MGSPGIRLERGLLFSAGLTAAVSQLCLLFTHLLEGHPRAQDRVSFPLLPGKVEWAKILWSGHVVQDKAGVEDTQKEAELSWLLVPLTSSSSQELLLLHLLVKSLELHGLGGIPAYKPRDLGLASLSLSCITMNGKLTLWVVGTVKRNSSHKKLSTHVAYRNYLLVVMMSRWLS